MVLGERMAFMIELPAHSGAMVGFDCLYRVED